MRASRRSPVCPATSGSRRRSTDWSTAARTFALLYADLDHFKAFNDHYGFMRGDQVIQATRAADARRWHGEITGGDAFVGHVGGDDFVLIVPPEKADATWPRPIVARFDQEVAGALRPGRPRARLGSRSRTAAASCSGSRCSSISIGVASTEQAHLRALRRGGGDRDRDEELHEGDRRVVLGDRPPHDLIRLAAERVRPGRSPDRTAPRGRRACRSSSPVSIPSATIVMSISSANEISADASARFARSPSMPRVRLMSTFTMSGREQQRVSQAREPGACVVDRDPHAVRAQRLRAPRARTS